ncbi:serine hydrolase domain-containing protein [Bacteroidota bacterium]
MTEFSGESLDSLIMDQINKTYTVSDSAMVAVSIYHDDGNGVVIDNAFLYSNANHPKPDTNTIFRIGSVTKTFNAFLIAQLAAEGKVKLKDPAQNYLPLNHGSLPDVQLPTTYNDSTVSITLEDLAIYGSGLPRNAPVYNGITPYDSMFTYLAEAPLLFAPGNSCYLYSNLGWAVLGLIPPYLEFPNDPIYYNRWFELLDNRLLMPLSMTDTRLELNNEQKNRKATGYPNEEYNPNWPANLSAGGLYSTISDMRKYQKALMNLGPLQLNQATLDTLLHLHGFEYIDTCSSSNQHYSRQIALAWFYIDEKEDNFSFYNKDGAVPGFSSYFTFGGPGTSRTGVIILSNNYHFPVVMAKNIHKWLVTGTLVP